ncbi:MAG: efflux RND transporter periplasmic adaptor subunit, partial [Alphaproteobacteria bacterium]|nr:efflux RND transporter periplasmic adaptor subunit [Alphaproteobacteria bacterium]
KGDVLAELDTVKIKAGLDRARAALAATEARIATAAATAAEASLALERAISLEKKGVSSAQVLEAARAAHDRAEASLKAAEADAAVARADVALEETDLAKSRIVSPVNGIVLKRTAEPGQTVASSLQAPVLFTLAEDLRRMQVEASIDEADIGAVATGQKASFTVDAFPTRRFPAVIESIDYSPTTTDNVVTYTAILSVDNGELLLRPGMTANAEIVVRKLDSTLAVANAALRFELPRMREDKGFSVTSLFLPRMPRFEKSSNKAAADGERTIYILADGVPKPIVIRAGDSDGELTEILAGDLKEGDPVITAARAAQP